MEWQRRPPGGLLPGDLPRRDPRQGPRRPPGAGDARTRIAVGAGHGRRQARGLRIWIQDGEGASFWAHVCADLANRGVQDVLIVCCDGLTGLPEAARGDLARLHGPDLRGPPDPRHPCGSSPTGTARGSPPPCARSAPPPTRRPPDGPQAPSASPTRAASTPRRRRRGRGPGRGSSPSWPSPRPCAGSPLHHQRRPSRPATEPRGPPRGAATISSDEAAAELLRPAGLQHPRGRRAAQRAKDEEHARPLAQGQRVDSSTGRVTTNRSTPPAHPARLAAAHPDRINPHL